MSIYNIFNEVSKIWPWISCIEDLKEFFPTKNWKLLLWFGAASVLIPPVLLQKGEYGVDSLSHRPCQKEFFSLLALQISRLVLPRPTRNFRWNNFILITEEFFSIDHGRSRENEIAEISLNARLGGYCCHLYVCNVSACVSVCFRFVNWRYMDSGH